MRSKKSFNFAKGDKVRHFKHGDGTVVRVLSGGTVEVQFSAKFEYVQASSLKDLEQEIKLAEAKRKQLIREKEYLANYTENRKKELEKQQAKIAQKKLIFKYIDKLLKSNFLMVDEYFIDSCQGIISQKEFDDYKVKFVQSWLVDNLPKTTGNASHPTLDADQALVVATVKGNAQVIARAGSGKTTTIVIRTFFLIKHCGVEPHNILLLAFNRKAVLEVKKRLLLLLDEGAVDELDAAILSVKNTSQTQRISKDEIEKKAVEKVIGQRDVILPHVFTFHGLAYSIVHPEEVPLHDTESDQSLSRVTQQIIDDYLQDKNNQTSVRELMMAHFKEDWNRIVEGGFHQNRDDFLRYRRSFQQQSLKGEYVKSYGEKLIADFLLEHGISYKYERNYHWRGINYRPDFTLFKSDKTGIIIEYFGMEGEEDYDDMSERKKTFWKEKSGWELLHYSPIDITHAGSEQFKKRLKLDIEALGFQCNRLSEDEIWLLCKERAIDRFTRAMVSFIGRCRKLALSHEALEALCTNYSTVSDIEARFLQFACKLYKDYLSTLAATGHDDFDGLLQNAVKELELGNTTFKNKYITGDLSYIKFISIDEYQDFSLLFNKLTQSIRQTTDNAQLCCVGDDWQAINGFAGSDLRYFKEIENYIESPRKLDIPTNYRSPHKIVSLGNSLMAGNGKPAVAESKAQCDVKLVDLGGFQPTSIEQDRHSGDIITPAVLRLVNKSLNRNQDVVLLCRKKYVNGYIHSDASNLALSSSNEIDNYLRLIRSFFPEELRNRITISTTHKYKGLEKQTVIVMDMVKRSYPLIHPDWVFTRVFGDNIDVIAEEEKRLLYVALTRTQKDLYIITDKKEASPFLALLEKDSNLTHIIWDDFPAFSAEGQAPKITLKISNNGYSEEGGTYPIKDLLHSAEYKWSPITSSWNKVIPVEVFTIDLISDEVWFEKAKDVRLALYNENDELIEQFRI